MSNEETIEDAPVDLSTTKKETGARPKTKEEKVIKQTGGKIIAQKCNSCLKFSTSLNQRLVMSKIKKCHAKYDQFLIGDNIVVGFNKCKQNAPENTKILFDALRIYKIKPIATKNVKIHPKNLISVQNLIIPLRSVMAFKNQLDKCIKNYFNL